MALTAPSCAPSSRTSTTSIEASWTRHAESRIREWSHASVQAPALWKREAPLRLRSPMQSLWQRLVLFAFGAFVPSFICNLLGSTNG